MRPAILATAILIATLTGGCAKNPETDCVASYGQESTGTYLQISNSTYTASTVAQSFKALNTNAFTTVSIKLQKVEGTTGALNSQTLTMTIETDSSGVPSGSALGTTTITTDSVSSASSNYYTFTFSSSITPATGTTYWIRIRPSYAASNTNYIKWLGHTGTTSQYSDGGAYYEISPSSFSNSAVGTTTSVEFRVGC